MSDLVRAAAVAWRDWDRMPASPATVEAREQAVGALATSLGLGTAALTALVQEARREGQGPDEALRRIASRARPTTPG